MHQRLSRQVMTILAFGMLALGVGLGGKWGERTLGGWHDLWGPGAATAIMLVLMPMLRDKTGKRMTLRIMAVTVLGLGAMWIGYVLGAIGLHYGTFLVLASLVLGLAVLLSVMYWVSILAKGNLGKLDSWLEKASDALEGPVIIMAGLSLVIGIIKSYAGVFGAGVNQWWGHSVLLVGLFVLVTFFLVPILRENKDSKAEG